MPELKRSTIYLEPHLQRALKLKAIQSDQSVSALVNKAIRAALAEDAIDLAALEERHDHAERDFSAFVQDLRKHGLV